jgi:hypothetical protein
MAFLARSSIFSSQDGSRQALESDLEQPRYSMPAGKKEGDISAGPLVGYEGTVYSLIVTPMARPALRVDRALHVRSYHDH